MLAVNTKWHNWGNGLRNCDMFSGRTVAFAHEIGCVMNLLLVLRRQDERLLHFMVRRRYRLVERMMRIATRFADPAPAVLMMGVIAALPQTRAPGMVGMFTLVVSHLLVQLLKRSVCRPRPSNAGGFASLIEAPDCFSFPSGHSAAAASLAFTIALVAPSVGVAALASAGLVGASRCYLGVHYPGDVVAGWTLSGLTFLAGYQLLPL